MYTLRNATMSLKWFCDLSPGDIWTELHRDTAASLRENVLKLYEGVMAKFPDSYVNPRPYLMENLDWLCRIKLGAIWTEYHWRNALDLNQSVIDLGKVAGTLDGAPTMQNVVHIKTADIDGPALDWAVEKCEGAEYREGLLYWPQTQRWQVKAKDYSTDWSWGGQIIERERISLDDHGKEWWATIKSKGCLAIGSTPLAAAMRCYVASKLGKELEIPTGLEPAAPRKMKP